MAETEPTHGACCPVINTLDIIGGKWKVLILYYLHGETRRFNELQRLLAGVTQRMLTLQLRWSTTVLSIAKCIRRCRRKWSIR